MKSSLIILAIIVIVASSACITSQQNQNNENVVPEKTFKILHIHSYHQEWVWTQKQDLGFNDTMSDLKIEHRVFYMDTKTKSSESEKQASGAAAREVINSWQPDLVYTTDDNVQQYVAKYYINSTIPFVFSAVNSNPEDYGYVGSTNNAGVLEREHSIETINLLRQIVPGIKKIAIISDTDRTWPPVINRTIARIARELPDIQVVSVDILKTYPEYKQKMLSYVNTADVVIHLGDFTFWDEQRKGNVPYNESERWAVENVKVPDASFWEDRIQVGGLLAGVAISGYEQGKGAGLIARKILVDGASPASLGFEQTYKGQPVINLARARDLEISVNSDILLTAKVFDRFSWAS